MKKKNKTQISINYGSGVISLPQTVLDYFDKARKIDIKVLLLLAGSGKTVSDIANELECDVSDVESSVSFWIGTGLVSASSDERARASAPASETTKKTAPTPHKDQPSRAKVTEIPQYTTAEMNQLLKKHGGSLELIDECQNIMGKIFTAADIKVLMGFVDYLGLSNDYILLLMHYAAKNDQRSMRYIEKLAISCLDDGFTDAVALQQELCAREERNAIQSKIKSIFGLGTRKLTQKELTQIKVWTEEYKFDLDVIEKAYEITVGATSKPSIYYANAILEGWYKEGVRDIEAVNALREKHDKEKQAQHAENSSFSVDDFFDAALKRSYSEK